MSEAACPYCGRPLAQVSTAGCGALEFPGASQERRDELCEVFETVRKRKLGVSA